MESELKNITLPLELFDGRFNFDQIGSIAILMAIPLMDSDTVTHWGNDLVFMPTVNQLVKDGVAIVIPEEDGLGLKLEIDLT